MDGDAWSKPSKDWLTDSKTRTAPRPAPLSQVLWAFATLVGNADSPAQELAGLVGALAEGFESEGAGGALGGGGGGSAGGGSGGSGSKGGGLDAATACDVLWSFATMGHPAHSLCEAMARDLVDKVRRWRWTWRWTWR